MPASKILLTTVALFLLGQSTQTLAKEATASAINEQQATQLKADFIKTQEALGFSTQESQDFLDKAHYNQKVINAISTPWEAKPWDQYYPIFLTDERLKAGLAFWDSHSDTIAKAAQEFKVDPQIIVAIIGVETYYGKHMGDYSTLNALYTLGFYYPPRATFFRKEFAQLQQLAKEEQLDVSQLKSSYAGAMGYGQFIPSSYRHYSVDFNQDGKRDLLNSPVDAIGSVANYFHKHGWQLNGPVAYPLSGEPAKDAKIWNKGKIHQQVKDIVGTKLKLGENTRLDPSQKAMLIQLPKAQADEYWLGLNNFYVITRYNHSPLYAMAVYQFSQELKQAHDKQNDKLNNQQNDTLNETQNETQSTH